ncbi:unnamed protein product [Musa textilis]
MKLMQKEPRLLCAKVETVLKPRLRSLQDMGFSDTEIVQLVSSCPSVLLLRDIQPKIAFWRSLLGSNERLIRASRRNMFLLTSSLSRKIEPNISLFRECGISEERIAHMVVTRPRVFYQTEKCIKEAIEYVEELGVSRGCKMFPYAVLSVMTLSRSRFDSTFATLISFGWSQPDTIAAFRKHPSIWNLSKKNLSDKMTFLTKEAGCELTYIIGHPVLLTYSLEKRLRPRYEVMNFLDQSKLLDGGHHLLSYVMLSEVKFRKKFLFLLSEEKFIALHDSYVAAVQGKHHVNTDSYMLMVSEIGVRGKVDLPGKGNQNIRLLRSPPQLWRVPWRKPAAAAALSSVELLSLRRFPRRTVDAAASSPSQNRTTPGISLLLLFLLPLPPFCACVISRHYFSGSFAFSHVTSPPSIFLPMNTAVCLAFPLPKTKVQIINPTL